MSLGLVVLEKKLFTRTRTRTPTPQTDDIMSADWQVSWHKNIPFLALYCCGNQSQRSLLYLARFSRYKHFCALQFLQKIQNGRYIWRDKNILKIGMGTLAEISSRSKILLNSLHLAQFSRYKHFCVFQKLRKFKIVTIFGETKNFENKTTATVCISRRALKEKKQLFRDIHNFSFSCVKALPNVGEWVIWEKLVICNTFKR